MADESSRLRDELADVLAMSTDRLRDAIRRELPTLQSGRRIQFEVDPSSFRISCCATEEDLLPDDWLEEALPEDWIERAQDADVNWDALISDTMCPWFADCWQSSGGLALGQASMFFHGFHQQQFDLRCKTGGPRRGGPNASPPRARRSWRSRGGPPGAGRLKSRSSMATTQRGPPGSVEPGDYVVSPNLLRVRIGAGGDGPRGLAG